MKVRMRPAMIAIRMKFIEVRWDFEGKKIGGLLSLMRIRLGFFLEH
jgi:hypothetical protein